MKRNREVYIIVDALLRNNVIQEKDAEKAGVDGKRLKNVVGYKIESTNPLAGVMLSLEVMVKLPEWRNLRK